jgi:hypothetical protein
MKYLVITIIAFMFIGCYGEMEDPATHKPSLSYNKCITKKTTASHTVYKIGASPRCVYYTSTNANLFNVGDTVEIVKWTKKK